MKESSHALSHGLNIEIISYFHVLIQFELIFMTFRKNDSPAGTRFGAELFFYPTDFGETLGNVKPYIDLKNLEKQAL